MERLSFRKNTFLENPSNGEIIAKITDSDEIDIDEAVKSASNALRSSWGNLSATEREGYCLNYLN